MKKLTRALDALSAPGFIKYAVRVRKRSVASFQICRLVKLEVGELDEIVDVGANQGQFALAANWFFPRATITSFEPVPSAAKRFEENVAQNSKITLQRVAVGRENGQIDFFENEYSHASSALKMHENQKILFGETAVKQISVPVTTLDAFFQTRTSGAALLLKLDVQGFEMDVLLGAREFLKRVKFVVFEASFRQLYIGERLFDEMHSYMNSLGFALVGPVGLLEGPKAEIVQLDLLYKRLG